MKKNGRSNESYQFTRCFLKILALDTSAQACSVAICDGDQVFSHHQLAPMQHTQLILATIHQLLEESRVSLSSLDFITYGCGPGSFTGIRIANSVAQGLGFAHKKLLVPVSSLAALAQTIYMREGCTAMWVAVDARMQQIYWANYHVINGITVECQGLEQLLYPSEIRSVENASSQVGVGDGWGKYASELSASLQSVPSRLYSSEVVHATALLPLARQYFEEGKGVTPDQALPVYLR